MTTAQRSTTPQQSTSPKACDPHEIAKLRCGPRRVEQQAKVTEETKETLEGYDDSLAAARTDYTAAWKTAEADTATAQATLDKVTKHLRCRLDEDTETCLDTVWGAVRNDLDECVSGTEGCRVGPCDQDESVPDDASQGWFAGRIEDLRDQAATHGTYFKNLLDEINKLPDRAVKAKTEVTQLEADAHVEEPTPDTAAGPVPAVVQLNARALVAQWRLNHVRGGFGSIDDYLDCLCQAWTAVRRTWSVIVTLEGEKAYRACIDGADTSSCAVLLADPVAAVVDRFAKDCSGKPSSSA